MFRWLKNLGSQEAGLDRMTRELERMIHEGRHIFDAASNVLLAGTDPEAIREDLFRTDQRINRLEQQIRRQLLVHGSVHGSSNLPELLVLMSVAKDAERIGDYAKNVFDLARVRTVPAGSAEHGELSRMRDDISALLAEAPEVYSLQDTERAQDFVQRAGTIATLCDDRIDGIVASEQGSGHLAGCALAYRYFKRVVVHIQNLVSSVVLPVDKLDFLDESHRKAGERAAREAGDEPPDGGS